MSLLLAGSPNFGSLKLTTNSPLVVDSRFPSVVSVTTTKFPVVVSSADIAMPATVNAGDLLLIFLYVSAQPILWVFSNTWTRIDGAANGSGLYAKRADGSEGGTIVSFSNILGGQTGVAQVYRIVNWTDTGLITRDVNSISTTGTSTTPDSPALTPSSWGAENALWISSAGWISNATVSATPSNYGGEVFTTVPTVSADSLVRDLNASSEDPSTFTISSSSTWRSFTVAVRGPGNVIVPAVGSLALASNPPLVTNVLIAPAAGTLTLTGNAPPPVIEIRDVNRVAQTTALNLYTITLPANVKQGDLLIVAFGVNVFDGPRTWNNQLGPWTLVANNIFGSHLETRYKVASSTDAGQSFTITPNGSGRYVYIAASIKNWNGLNVSGNNTIGTSASADSPALSPSWGSATDLWMAFSTIDTGDVDPTGFPTNYSLNTSLKTAGSGAGHVELAGSDRRLVNASTEDPSAFTYTASHNWVTHTISIKEINPGDAVIFPDSGSLSLSGTSSLLDCRIITGAGSLTLTSFAPASSGVTITPSVGSLILTGQSSILDLRIFTGVGSLALSGTAPAVIQGTILTPAVGSLVITSIAPSIIIGNVIVPAIATLVITGIAPTVLSNNIITPATGALTLTGPPNTLLDLRIITSVGALTLTGIAPLVVSGVIPGTGALTLTGFGPVLDLRIITSAGSLTLNGIAPAIVQGTILTPSASSLILAGSAPSLILGNVVVPTAGTLTFSTSSSLLDLRIITSAGTLTLTGAAPAVITGTILTPSVGSLVLSGVSATRWQSTITTPLVGALTLTSIAPNILLGNVIFPNAGTLTISGVAPLISSPIQPTVGSLVLTGGAPLLDLKIFTSTGTLSLTGTAPVIVQGRIITPLVGSLTLTSIAPTLITGTIITPTAGTLTLTGQSSTEDERLFTNTGTLTLSGIAPTIVLGTIITPSVGSLLFAGIAPVTIRGTIVTPNAGSLSISGGTSIFSLGIVVSTGTLTLISNTPIVSFSGGLTPFAGSLVLAGVSPVIIIGRIISPLTGSATFVTYNGKTYFVARTAIGFFKFFG